MSQPTRCPDCGTPMVWEDVPETERWEWFELPWCPDPECGWDAADMSEQEPETPPPTSLMELLEQEE